VLPEARDRAQPGTPGEWLAGTRRQLNSLGAETPELLEVARVLAARWTRAARPNPGAAPGATVAEAITLQRADRPFEGNRGLERGGAWSAGLFVMEPVNVTNLRLARRNHRTLRKTEVPMAGKAVVAKLNGRRRKEKHLLLQSFATPG